MNILHGNYAAIILPISICVISSLYFFITIHYQPFKKLNSWLITKKQEWSRSNRPGFMKRHPIAVALTCWIVISGLFITVPFRVYKQPAPSYPGPEGRTIGIWAGGQHFDSDNINESFYLSNETLEMFAAANIYIVTGCKQSDIGVKLIERLNRCKEYGLEVHLSISTMHERFKYVNIWTFELLMTEIDAVLTFLNSSNLLGDPISTLVYDMECLPEALFLIYFDPEIRAKLPEYYVIYEMFIQFNQQIRDDYNLNIRICSDYFLGFDRNDMDDDIQAMLGVMDDENASNSYMVYRRNNLGQNQILDHFRFLSDGDTIILNAWKFEGYLCWGDINCAIEDCQLVLGYTKKRFNLEIWRLDYFLNSYGIEGLNALVTNLSSDWSEWTTIKVRNDCPYSPYWDLVFYGVSLLDLYGPLFRLINNAI